MQVKNKNPAQIQITAEQILREAQERQEAPHSVPQQKITDLEELQDYRQDKRRTFENLIRRNRQIFANWMRYAQWEESQDELERYISNQLTLHFVKLPENIQLYQSSFLFSTPILVSCCYQSSAIIHNNLVQIHSLSQMTFDVIYTNILCYTACLNLLITCRYIVLLIFHLTLHNNIASHLLTFYVS